ncbi:hypothetical protein GN956_G2096 [Arapaima gigas]
MVPGEAEAHWSAWKRRLREPSGAEGCARCAAFASLSHRSWRRAESGEREPKSRVPSSESASPRYKSYSFIRILQHRAVYRSELVGRPAVHSVVRPAFVREVRSDWPQPSCHSSHGIKHYQHYNTDEVEQNAVKLTWL